MKFPEQYRRFGILNESGAFLIPFKGSKLTVIAGDNEDAWEHVSVSLKSRCPIWDEMCFIKDLFWKEEECVMQYHPPKSIYVNIHPYCLHLWRPINYKILMPAHTKQYIKRGS